jgi:prepilin-type N-terminal cleavage/methylation domain-containing protein
MSLRRELKKSGFTIVELLVVIVVIAILATITIVAYNGIQNRSKTTSAQSSAATVMKKAELYNTGNGNYPITFATLTNAATTDPWYVANINRSAGALSNNSSTNEVSYWVCGQSSTSTPLAGIANITTSNVSGIRVFYRDYGASSNIFVDIGTATTPSGQNPVSCFNSTS